MNKQFEIDNIPFKGRLAACYEGTRAGLDLARKVMIPQLEGLIRPSRTEMAIRALYHRMYLWMESLVALDNTRHFQVAATAARSMFELLLDIRLLIDDKPEHSIDKFEAFVEVEEFRMAKQFIDFKKKNPQLEYPTAFVRERIANKRG